MTIIHYSATHKYDVVRRVCKYEYLVFTGLLKDCKDYMSIHSNEDLIIR